MGNCWLVFSRSGWLSIYLREAPSAGTYTYLKDFQKHIARKSAEQETQLFLDLSSLKHIYYKSAALDLAECVELYFYRNGYCSNIYSTVIAINYAIGTSMSSLHSDNTWHTMVQGILNTIFYECVLTLTVKHQLCGFGLPCTAKH